MKNQIRVISFLLTVILVFACGSAAFAGESLPEGQEKSDETGGAVTRIAGANRYETALLAAEATKDLPFGSYDQKSIIIASGKDYPDALGGSYLSNLMSAPILLVDDARVKMIASYVAESTTGKIYILGGEGAVPASMESELKAAGVPDSRVIMRFSGADRYETNIMILKQMQMGNSAGTVRDVLVCSGKNYADALSASAVGFPILLVGDRLTDAQNSFISDNGSIWRFHIIGGTGAVSEAVASELDSLGKGAGGYGVVERIAGSDRYETSKLTAVRFFGERGPCDTVVLASGSDFPDGLSAAPVAFSHRAPLLLAGGSNTAEAAEAAKALGASDVIVMGGPTIISDEDALRVVQ